ncbi:MAG: response regulator transcription factor [Myxococcales bacterium]
MDRRSARGKHLGDEQPDPRRRLPLQLAEARREAFLTDTVATIAIVDDDHSVRRGLARLLKAAGYRVEAFASARDYLEREGPAPSCLLLDVSMPGQTGLHLYDDLLAKGDGTPVIFITGHADAAAADHAAKAGAYGFLTKPFEESALLSAIERAMANASSPRK